MVRGGFWFRGVAVGAAVALASVLCVSVASAAPPPGVSMQGTGPQPAGLGMFSDAALAQKTCADNGRTTSSFAGGGPWCVNPWSAGTKNGGATAQGVTATTVNVVAYLPNNPNARYIQAQPGMLANGARNTEHLNPTDNIDLSILKRVNLNERFKLELAGRFVNFLNHPQYIGDRLSDVLGKGHTGTQVRNFR